VNNNKELKAQQDIEKWISITHTAPKKHVLKRKERNEWI